MTTHNFPYEIHNARDFLTSDLSPANADFETAALLKVVHHARDFLWQA